ncbi:AMP-binding protein [Microbacterium sp. NPDC055312]
MTSLSPATSVDLIGGDRTAVALCTDDGDVTYGELADLAARVRDELGTTRRLVLLEAANTVPALAAYLGALAGGHPVLLAPGGDDESAVRTREMLIERFDPDVVAAPSGLRPRREGTAHTLHDELALLASTSGSTGSPKLVRISAHALLSNAAAIAEYLRLDATDRAITTLPLHYCYGLSVVNSHLLAGGSIVLSDRSVSDESFWHRAEQTGVTGIAGVPYTFELIDAVGGVERLPSSIRYLTQAGGRLPAEHVRRLALAGRERGFDFFTMYGQTEATARMSYLPPSDAVSAAGSIGRAIPGGTFRIDAPAGESGELVYSGPNVMLGYAEDPADLALGRTVDELRTGDLARWRDDGYVEIVGRMNRFVKIFGLRIDLDVVQAQLAESGILSRTAADGEELLVFVRSGRDVSRARDEVSRRIGVPPAAVSVHTVDAFPVTSSGKPDNAALVAHHRAARRSYAPRLPSGEATPGELRDALAVCTGRADATEHDSFAALGGDSLSYVEASVRLEELLGALPRDWPSLSPVEMVERAEPAAPATPAGPSPAAADDAPQRRSSPRRALAAIETPVLLRAIAIVLIVGTHADLFLGDGFSLKGGAHLLLVVAGYNLARFALSPSASDRPRRLLTALGQVAIPAVLWIGVVGLISGKYHPTTALLVNNAVPTNGVWNEQWQFWFLEAMVWTMLALAAVFAVPAVDRLERRAPWAFAMAALGLTVVVRFALLGAQPAEHLERYAIATVLWCIALGAVVARADDTRRRIVATLLTAALVPGFFGEPLREGIVAVGVLALIWLPAVPLPVVLRPALTTLASASLFIYLTHWVVYPPFEQTAPLVGTLLSLAVGIMAWSVHRRGQRFARSVVARVRA